jgi:superfamily II DNA/RNA helicase
VRTKRGADRLARNLKQQGFHVGALHGDMSQPQRERALGQFAAGHSDVLVATDVAARGLDLEHISHVINFDPPGDEKAYVHRVGRTARAGRAGEGITFVTPQQVDEVRVIARLLDLHTEFDRAGLRAEKSPPAAPRQRHRPRRPQQPQQNRRRSRR